MKLGPDGLPIAEWVLLDTKGHWGLWCRWCKTTERAYAIPDGESGKALMVEAFVRRHEPCAPPSVP